MINNSLDGKIALVTGASGGLGSEICYSLAAAGAYIIVHYNKNKAAAELVAETIISRNGKAIVVRADIAVEKENLVFAEQVKKLAGNVDILVNNAGINPVKPLLELNRSDFQNSLDINLTASFLTIQGFLPGMIKNGFGRIISMSSIAAQTGGVIGPHYAAAKAGLIGLTHSYAALLPKYGDFTVNAVAPALIETAMIAGNPLIYPRMIPLGRFGQPAEVADIVLMLATNGYINGQTINVNGGWYMN